MAPLIPVKVLCSHQNNTLLYKQSKQYPLSLLLRTDNFLTVPVRGQHQVDELLDCPGCAEHCGIHPGGKALQAAVISLQALYWPVLVYL